jgi:methionyl-tRNA synthetase
LWDPIYGEVKELVEENWYFKMSRHQQWLIDYIEGRDVEVGNQEARREREHFIQPEQRRNEVLGFLKNNQLEDLCISRPKARLSWGIPMPFDAEYVNYVWFDALVNYVSAAAAQSDPTVLAVSGELDSALRTPHPALTLWPADYHVIGKDIVKFHAVYWPIMLKAMGLDLPQHVLVHGFWQKDGEKMSKTTGNIVDPVAVIDEWGLDAFRYYVVRELDIGPDGNWTDAGFAARYRAELANGLGNLVNRSLSMLKRYRNGVVPTPSVEFSSEANALAIEAQKLLLKHQLQAALQAIWSLVTRANQYVDQTAPFKLAKDLAQAKRLDEVLYNLAETCRVIAVLLWPFMPTTAEKIYRQLGLSASPDRFAAATGEPLKPGHTIGEVAPLFPRRDSPKP